MAEETLRRSQNSFSGGEIGAKVLGRVDLAKFNAAMRYALNVFCEIEGAVSNRAGTEFGGTTLGVDGPIRFIPFEAPGDINYVIEMTHQKFRFYFDNAVVLTDALVPLEVSTPYTEDQLYDLVFTQTNDIMTIVHASHAPRELRRTAVNVFSLHIITANPSSIAPPTISIVDSNGVGAGETEQAYVVSSIDANGIEGLPSAKIFSENNLDDSGAHNTVGWTEVAGADAYIVYKRRAGTYGFMGYVRAEDNFGGTAPTRTYRSIDNNINPNTSQTPKREENPFPDTDHYPAVAFIYQQRRSFAAWRVGPNSITNSQVGAFDGFRRSVPSLPDDYFEFALGAARTAQIKHVVSLEDLLIFTSSGEWRLKAEDGYSASQPPNLKLQSENGVSEIPPLTVGTDVFYFPPSKRTVYRMNFSFDFNKFMSDDISILSKHLFKRRRVVSWCYAQEPHFLVFVALSDGKGLFLAYNREQQVYGWTRFETNGFVEACTSIREDGIDRIYLAVRRRIGGSYVRYFERLAERDIDNTADSFFVDCGVKQDDFIEVDTIEGGVIYTLDAHGLSEGSEIRLYDIVGEIPGSTFNINTRFRASPTNSNEFTLLDYLTSAPVDIDDFVYSFGGKVRLMGNVITGLGHLEGMTVNALADGFVVENLVVDSGQVELPINAGIRTAGLGYTSEVHTLELEREDEPTRGRQKTVAHLVARVDETRGIAIGTKPSNVREVRERRYEAYPDPVNPKAEIIREALGVGWEDEVRLIIRQTKPLPMTVLSVIPEYTFGS